jgi:hypothetical protein
MAASATPYYFIYALAVDKQQILIHDEEPRYLRILDHFAVQRLDFMTNRDFPPFSRIHIISNQFSLTGNNSLDSNG